LILAAREDGAEFFDYFNLYDKVERYKDVMILAIKNIQDWHISTDRLLNHPEFLEMISKPENLEMLEAYYYRIMEGKDERGNDSFLAELFKEYPIFLNVFNNSKSLPINTMKHISDRKTALDIYPKLKHDIDVPDLPSNIKINKSIYQNEQRAEEFREYTRYTIANNNLEPTEVLYDIGKQLVHAGDGVDHTNVGTSGFTNSWSLVSFVDQDNYVHKGRRDDEDWDEFRARVDREAKDISTKEVVIEQYQSDYPPVLHQLFGGENQEALNNLIHKYADPELLKEFEAGIGVNTPQVGQRVQILQGSERGKSGVINKITPYRDYSYYMVEFSDEEDGTYEVNFEVDYLADEDGNEFREARVVEYPIDIAPQVKDARKHIEYLSKAYPFISIINAIKVAQTFNKDYIFISINAPEYANIGNKNKAKKLYTDIPLALEAEEASIQGEPVWKIPATGETIQKAEAMAQRATGKDKDYNYSLTPKQNIEIKEKTLREEKKKKRQGWQGTPEKMEQLMEINEQVRALLPEVEVPDFITPQQGLRYLNQEVNGKIINKKRFKKDFGLINRNLGMLSRASRRKNRLIKMASLIRRINILKGFNDENQ